MKKLLILTLCLLTLAGCGVPQEDHDALKAQLEETQADLDKSEASLKTANTNLTKTKKELTEAKADIKELEKDNKTLQTEKTDLTAQLEKLQKDYDELKNGPAAQLAKVRTAYEGKKWSQVISLAKTLHSKYPGHDADLEAQQLANDAQKILDEEAAKAAAEKAKTLEEKAHSLIRVTRFGCGKPNSAGGVSYWVYFQNMDKEKTIKYITFNVSPYNAVGDEVDCDIRGYSRYGGYLTGPVAPGAEDRGSWSNAWYNWSITEVRFNSIEIEYTDGSYVTLWSESMPYVQW